MTGCVTGILRDNALMQAIDDSMYHEKSYAAFMPEAETVLEQTGLSKTILEEVLPLRKFYIDEKQCMEDTLGKQESSVTEDRIREEVKGGITAYYKDAGMVITSELDTKITQASDILSKEYTEWMRLTFLSSISDYWKGIRKNMLLAMPLCILLSGIIIFAMCRMYHYKHRALRYVAAGTIGAVLLNGVSVYLLQGKMDYAKAIEGPAYYKDFINAYFTTGITTIKHQMITGTVLCIIVVTILCAMRKHVTGE